MNLVLWQHVVLCKSYANDSAPGNVCRVLCSLRVSSCITQAKMILGSKHVKKGAILNVLM